MKEEASIRPTDQPAPKPQVLSAERPQKKDDDKPTECGLTRKELRAIVEEIIG